jgi:hypothetical protein
MHACPTSYAVCSSAARQQARRVEQPYVCVCVCSLDSSRVLLLMEPCLLMHAKHSVTLLGKQCWHVFSSSKQCWHVFSSSKQCWHVFSSSKASHLVHSQDRPCPAHCNVLRAGLVDHLPFVKFNGIITCFTVNQQAAPASARKA